MGGWAWLIWTGVCIAAAMAIVAGGLLLGMALSGKRHGTPIGADEAPHGRCDCCGYELEGLEEGYCPECGWQYAGNHRLPPGRRVRLAVGGTSLLLLAGASAAMPQIINHGVLSLFPNWALIVALPLAPGGDPSNGMTGGAAAATTNVESGSELHRVLRARLDREAMSLSERSWLASRCAGVVARSGDERARLAAAALLARVGEAGGGGTALAIAGLDDPSARVRERIADALGRLAASARSEHERRPMIRGLLGAAVCDRDQGVRRAAIDALGRLDSAMLVSGDHRGVTGVLTRAAHDPCPAVRIRTMYVLSTRGLVSVEAGAADAWDLDIFTQAAHDPHPGVREAAVYAMSRVGDGRGEIIALLGEALSDSAREVREMAASALARLGQRAAPMASALVERLYDEDPNVQEAAGRALGAIGS